MVRKSILSFLLFSIFYAFLVSLVKVGIGTNQWQENQIRAQRYLYEPSTDTVMLGTSLSARILLDSIPMVTSCSFSACVVEDGLRIVLSKQSIPQVVLIESNYFLRPSNGELVKVNTTGIMAWLRKLVPMLREYYSPICILGAYSMRGALSPSMDVDSVRLFRNIKQRISEDNTHILTERQIEERLNVIIPLIHEIEAHGAKIIFYEVPLNKRLLYLPSNNQTRQTVRHSFPPSHYLYLPTDTSHYLTNDGEHLDYQGQRRYSSFIKKALCDISK